MVTEPLPAAHRWVLLALQLPATPSNARVKVWRRLQHLGAVPVKNAVYVLPSSSQAVEDFTWLGREVDGLGGQATVFQADAVDTTSDADIVELFRRTRALSYKQLLVDVRSAAAPKRRPKARLDGKIVRQLRERFEHLRSIDFFAAPGRDELETLLSKMERDARPVVPSCDIHSPLALLDPKDFAGRQWVTRPRPGVDRFACAWLIRRFIDAQATFAFAAKPSAIGAAVAFDMYGAGFGHEGDRCTFEVLALRFGISDGAVQRLAEIVHDLDLKDERYRPAHAPTIGLIVEGLRAAVDDDHELLRQGIALFDALYRALREDHRQTRETAATRPMPRSAKRRP